MLDNLEPDLLEANYLSILEQDVFMDLKEPLTNLNNFC